MYVGPTASRVLRPLYFTCSEIHALMHFYFGRARAASFCSVLALVFCAHCSPDSNDQAPVDDDADAGGDASVDASHADRDEDSGDGGTDAAGDADDDAPSCAAAMRAVPAGTFERAEGTVTTSAFCLDRTEVTVGDFEKCVAAGACDAIPESVDVRCNVRVGGRNEHPVDCVTAAQAESFCTWKSKRLPTSNELSWAARGAVATAKYPWGTDDPASTDEPPRLCWAPVSPDQTCVAGSFERGASPQGVFDLAGNVWEWTSTDAGDGDRRVQGGAYWDEAPLLLFQADHWEPMPADTAAPAYGFRCAADPIAASSRRH